MKNKISVKLVGPGEIVPGFHNFGLCNQMFQIAAAISYAWDNDFDAIFPVLKDKNKYGTYTNNIFRKLNIENELPREHGSASYGLFKEEGFLYNPIPKRDQSFIIHDSYLQSEKYFCHNRDLILDLFEAREKDIEYLMKKYGEVIEKENTVSCHIRRGDYIKLKTSHIPLWESDYYKNALDEFDDPFLIIFSDDIEWCKEYFSNEKILFVEEEDYLELYLMSMCKNNIIANSSFSWWGAWLNKNSNKKIIAPSQWFGPEHVVTDNDLVPEKWIVI